MNTRFSRPFAAGLCALGLLACGAAALAQDATPGERFEQRVDNRQARQEQRIDQGVQSGALTPREARRLEREQAAIARAEGRVEADGRITRREAHRLEQRQDAASRHIHRQKHDRQARP